MRSILALSTLLIAVAASTQTLVTFYSEKNYNGESYTLQDKSANRCVKFTKAPLVVESVQVFDGAVVQLYSDPGCSYGPANIVIQDKPDTGHIEVRSVVVVYL